MNKIRFSHRYYKMPSEEWIPNTTLEAKLLEVLLCNREDLSEGFVEYDTAFCECLSKVEQKYRRGFYPLPKGKLIILLLQTHNSTGVHIWTTIRRWTPEKEKYYKSKRGETFKIEILEEHGKI